MKMPFASGIRTRRDEGKASYPKIGTSREDGAEEDGVVHKMLAKLPRANLSSFNSIAAVNAG